LSFFTHQFWTVEKPTSGTWLKNAGMLTKKYQSSKTTKRSSFLDSLESSRNENRTTLNIILRIEFC
jgi:hypothetical protein